MIKFFRKIRQQLLSQNRFSKYMLYAIGEIVLVVIGILIALSINNWNQEREQQQKVRTYLTNFMEDLKNNITEYEDNKEEFVFRFNSLQYLLTLAGEIPVRNDEGVSVIQLDQNNRLWNKQVPKIFNKEFVNLAFLQSIRGITTVVNKTAIEELKSTGTFSLINNEEIKDAINSYYSEIEWRFGAGNHNYNINLRNKWQESFMKSGILVQDMNNIADPIGLLKMDSERIGLLRAIIRANWFKYNSVVKLEKKAYDLIALIETEISN